MFRPFRAGRSRRDVVCRNARDFAARTRFLRMRCEATSRGATPGSARRKSDYSPATRSGRLARVVHAARQRIGFARLLSGCRRLSDRDACESFTQHPQVRLRLLTLEQLHEEDAVVLENVTRESRRTVRELAPTCLIVHLHATQIGCHVRHYKVDRPPADACLQPTEHFRVTEISLNELDSGNRLHLQDVEGDESAAGGERAACNLGPSSGSGAEVDDHPRIAKQVIARIDGFELERSARTQPAPACFPEEGVAGALAPPGSALACHGQRSRTYMAVRTCGPDVPIAGLCAVEEMSGSVRGTRRRESRIRFLRPARRR